MTKKQLIKELEEVDDDTVIILSSDSEGNSFDSLSDVGSNMYMVGNPGDGDFYETNAEGNDMDEGEFERLKKKAKKIVILWP